VKRLNENALKRRKDSNDIKGMFAQLIKIKKRPTTNIVKGPIQEDITMTLTPKDKGCLVVTTIINHPQEIMGTITQTLPKDPK